MLKNNINRSEDNINKTEGNLLGFYILYINLCHMNIALLV